jgi:hypothetical protein
MFQQQQQQAQQQAHQQQLQQQQQQQQQLHQGLFSSSPGHHLGSSSQQHQLNNSSLPLPSAFPQFHSALDLDFSSLGSERDELVASSELRQDSLEFDPKAPWLYANKL